MLSFPPPSPAPCGPCSSCTSFLDVSHTGQLCVPWALLLPGMFFLQLSLSSLSPHGGPNHHSSGRTYTTHSLSTPLPSLLFSHSNCYFLILLYLSTYLSTYLARMLAPKGLFGSLLSLQGLKESLACRRPNRYWLSEFCIKMFVFVNSAPMFLLDPTPGPGCPLTQNRRRRVLRTKYPASPEPVANISAAANRSDFQPSGPMVRLHLPPADRCGHRTGLGQ